MKQYRCTRNASYSHDCIGRDDITARQGHYVSANSKEEAWRKMAIEYPNEVEAGFTIQEWESFNVTVVEVKRDSEGNVIEVDQHGNIVKIDENGNVTN